MIFRNKKEWEIYNEEQMYSYICDIFTHYRNNGFPYFPTTKEYRQSEFSKLKNFVINNTTYEDGVIKQTMHGLGLCWSYFPHAYNVRCNNKMTPLEAFNNDSIFKKVISKRLKMGDNISDNGIRKMLKIYTNVQSVSLFRPTASAGIYDYSSILLNKDKINVYDMSGGYGGRLFGAIASPKINEYYTTDPCEKTYLGLKEICRDFKPEWFNNINMVGSEDFLPIKLINKMDLCFTSPPYFDTEHYSSELTQSYIKYNDKKTWLNDFLLKTINNCYYLLNNSGLLMLNIAPVKSYTNLVKDLIQNMDLNKWVYLNEIQLTLSSLSKKNKFKYEPILIFKKI